MKSSEALVAIHAALKAATRNDSIALPIAGDLVQLKVVDSLEGMVFLLELSKLTGVEFPEEDPIEQKLFDIKRLTEYLVEHSHR